MRKQIVITENQLKKLIKRISVRKFLSEAKITRPLLNSLLEKWRNEEPNLTEENVEQIYDRYSAFKDNLNPNQGNVNSFLARFDGTLGFENFDESNLKDITKYTFRQINFLVNQYHPPILDENENIRRSELYTLKPKENIIQLGRDLWYGDKFKIIDEGDFRVYKIPDMMESVKFGHYYREKIYKKQTGRDGGFWCVTHPLPGSNLWGNYRSGGKSFYFVIDESKDENTDEYFMGALQFNTKEIYDENYRYSLTSLTNKTDNSWENVIKNYPKIAQHKDLIVEKEFTNEELIDSTRVGRVNEDPGPYEFRKEPNHIKEGFINAGGYLKKPESWRSMNDELKSLYINTTTLENLFLRFETYELFEEIKKEKSHFNNLDRKIGTLGHGGISYMMKRIFMIRFDTTVAHTNVKNSEIVMLMDKKTKKYGIADVTKSEWYEKNGVIYDPVYLLNSRKPLMSYKVKDDANNTLLNKRYSVLFFQSTIDNNKFYCIKDPLNKGYFLTERSWLKFLEDHQKEEEQIVQAKLFTSLNKDVSPDVGDIEESNRRFRY